MSTQTLTEGARQLAAAVLVDKVQICDVGPVVTTGFEVTRELTPVGDPCPGLVQAIKPQFAVDSVVDGLYSVKVPVTVPLNDGQAVTVIECVSDPALVGMTLLIDRVLRNGAAMIHKGIATDFVIVNQEGKEGLA